MYVQRCPVCGYEHQTNDRKNILLICPNGHEAIGGVLPQSSDELNVKMSTSTVITFKTVAGECNEVDGFDSPDHSVILGREAMCADLFATDPAVSRSHLLIFLCEGDLVATDLSTYGATKINGNKLLLESTGLRKGDELVLGDTTLVVEDIVIGSEETKRED